MGKALRELDDDRKKLVEEHAYLIPLVHALCRSRRSKVHNAYMALSEAEAEAEAGWALVRAALTWDPAKGEYKTHAVNYIMWGISDAAKAKLGISMNAKCKRPEVHQFPVPVGNVDPYETTIPDRVRQYGLPEDERQALEQALDRLPGNGPTVMRALFFHRRTLETVAAQYRVSKEAVRQWKERWLAILRADSRVQKIGLV